MKYKILRTASILLIIAYYLIAAWITILNEDYFIQWRHITALLFFIPLPVLIFTNYKVAVLGTGIYLLIGFIGVLSLTAGISFGSINLAGLVIAGFNPLALGLLVLFILLHLDILIEMRLDYLESKRKDK